MSWTLEERRVFNEAPEWVKRQMGDATFARSYFDKELGNAADQRLGLLLEQHGILAKDKFLRMSNAGRQAYARHVGDMSRLEGGRWKAVHEAFVALSVAAQLGG